MFEQILSKAESKSFVEEFLDIFLLLQSKMDWTYETGFMLEDKLGLIVT